mmetsp:Transcript_57562/g.114246  ORF Transcript_57562/g.114246 Transcript_57562/m.114246 type:complete len:173 (+) Transcript_57562:101-619(+)
MCNETVIAMPQSFKQGQAHAQAPAPHTHSHSGIVHGAEATRSARESSRAPQSEVTTPLWARSLQRSGDQRVETTLTKHDRHLHPRMIAPRASLSYWVHVVLPHGLQSDAHAEEGSALCSPSYDASREICSSAAGPDLERGQKLRLHGRRAMAAGMTNLVVMKQSISTPTTSR